MQEEQPVLSVSADSRDTSPSVGASAQKLLDQWLRSQNSQDFETYSHLYAPDFVGIKRAAARRKEFDLAGWLDDRRSMFASGFTVKASGQRIDRKPDGTTVIRFTHEWTSPKFADTGTKDLQPTSASRILLRNGTEHFAEWAYVDFQNLYPARIDLESLAASTVVARSAAMTRSLAGSRRILE